MLPPYWSYVVFREVTRSLALPALFSNTSQVPPPPVGPCLNLGVLVAISRPVPSQQRFSRHTIGLDGNSTAHAPNRVVLF